LLISQSERNISRDLRLTNGVRCRSTTVQLHLIQIERDGTLRGYDGAMSELARAVLTATTDLYATGGFETPWTGYFALSDDALADDPLVGSCGFKSPPRDGRVELAYFTFPGHEGQGVATAMAAQLVALAQECDPGILIAAQTLEERSASHAILEKLGFRQITTIVHPEDGTVWEWQLGFARSA
jgi:[ribosomal protein S5]-alanine N-acetyltransferase